MCQEKFKTTYMEEPEPVRINTDAFKALCDNKICVLNPIYDLKSENKRKKESYQESFNGKTCKKSRS